MSKIRLDKYLADMQIGTRSEVKNLIRKKRISVNDTIITSPEYKIDADSEVVKLDGEEIGYTQYEYFMLNKPAGVLSASKDTNTTTVIDLINQKKRKDLFPVGRLDKDTEGLLLITNDGELAHKLLSPKKHVNKTYFASIRGKVSDQMSKQFETGIELEPDFVTLPASITLVKYDNLADTSDVLITICEGKFHQIKRMVAYFGSEVLYLKRLQMGSLQLDESLNPGEYRTLTDDEINSLYQ